MSRILQYYFVFVYFPGFFFFPECWARLCSSIILMMSSFALLQIVDITRYDEGGHGPDLSRRFAWQMLTKEKVCGKA